MRLSVWLMSPSVRLELRSEDCDLLTITHFVAVNRELCNGTLTPEDNALNPVFLISPTFLHGATEPPSLKHLWQLCHGAELNMYASVPINPYTFDTRSPIHLGCCRLRRPIFRTPTLHRRKCRTPTLHYLFFPGLLCHSNIVRPSSNRLTRIVVAQV